MSWKSLAFAASTAASLLLANPAAAATWTVDREASTLGFEVAQGEGKVTGQFQEWTADIDFDPNTPETAVISARIKPMSASTGNPQFDGTLPTPDWFDAGKFPDAEFKTVNVTSTGSNSYQANGTLTIKGISHPVALTFTLDVNGDTATASGSATVDRLDYKLGSAVGADTVGAPVTVTLSLTAVR